MSEFRSRPNETLASRRFEGLLAKMREITSGSAPLSEAQSVQVAAYETAATAFVEGRYDQVLSGLAAAGLPIRTEGQRLVLLSEQPRQYVQPAEYGIPNNADAIVENMSLYLEPEALKRSSGEFRKPLFFYSWAAPRGA